MLTIAYLSGHDPHYFLNLVINPDEEATVKLIFYMYLYGYSTSDIAAALTELGKKTYLGNVNWTSNSIVQVLRNERHCGDVLTRKTFTPNYLNHKSKKNRGDRPQSIYRNHHQGIVSRDDFIAVQHLLNNAKYGNKSILPELRVIDSGILKGFVTVNPRWAGFKPADYFQAAASIQPPSTLPGIAEIGNESAEIQITVEAGDFDMRGFEITRSEFFDSCQRPYVILQDKPLPGGTANRVKISEKGKKNYQSVEFYSAILLNSLFAVTGPLDYRCNYYLTGEVDQINRVAYFSLKTLKAVERKRLNGRQGV